MDRRNSAYDRGYADFMSGSGYFNPYKTESLQDAYDDGYHDAEGRSEYMDQDDNYDPYRDPLYGLLW